MNLIINHDLKPYEAVNNHINKFLYWNNRKEINHGIYN